MRTLHGSRCVRVKRVRVIILCSLPSRSLMSLLNIPHCSFPRVLSSPTCSRSRSSASNTSMGRSFRENPCEPARWSGMSGRLANPAPNTGYEPNPSNFFTYVDTVHTCSHHDFPCQDDATMTSTTDREGLPHSGASSSSKHTAASGVPSTFGLQASGNDGRSCHQASKKLRQFHRQSAATTIHSREGREIETQTAIDRVVHLRLVKSSSMHKRM